MQRDEPPSASYGGKEVLAFATNMVSILTFMFEGSGSSLICYSNMIQFGERNTQNTDSTTFNTVVLIIK